MEKIELQLDEQILARALRLAASRQCSLEELIKGIIEQSAFQARLLRVPTGTHDNTKKRLIATIHES